MKFTKKTDYTLRILNHMSKDSDKIYRATDLQESLDIPFRYLRKLLTILSKSELISSTQGKEGGYRIGRSPESIKLIDIVKATGDDIIEQRCFFGYETCSLHNPCNMHHKWEAITNNLNEVLESTNLAELIKTSK